MTSIPIMKGTPAASSSYSFSSSTSLRQATTMSPMSTHFIYIISIHLSHRFKIYFDQVGVLTGVTSANLSAC